MSAFDDLVRQLGEEMDRREASGFNDFIKSLEEFETRRRPVMSKAAELPRGHVELVTYDSLVAAGRRPVSIVAKSFPATAPRRPDEVRQRKRQELLRSVSEASRMFKAAVAAGRLSSVEAATIEARFHRLAARL